MNLAPPASGNVPPLVRAGWRSRQEPSTGSNAVRGLRIGSWLATRLLAAGLWMRVYRARPADWSDPASLGDFVVKRPSPQCADDSIPRALLRREAAVARRVQHPHLTAILADHTASEPPHLVLPYLDGTTLQHVFAATILNPASARVLIPAATACLIARQVAKALSALHEAGWLYGNVHPGNVLVAASGHATLLGLGLARRIGSQECSTDWLWAATPAYAAPEHNSPHGQITPAADIYRLGLLLFEMLAGRPPFLAGAREELIRQHRREAPPDIRALRPGVSPNLAELIRRMLAKEPLRRPPACDVARWLAEIEIDELAAS